MKLDRSLLINARGEKYLFLVVFDEESKIPMPYGAFRTPLSISDSVELGKYALTEHSLQVMNPSAAKPKNFRIKARLEYEGLAGPDKEGDLVGYAHKVKLGTSTTIVINKRIKNRS